MSWAHLESSWCTWCNLGEVLVHRWHIDVVWRESWNWVSPHENNDSSRVIQQVAFWCCLNPFLSVDGITHHPLIHPSRWLTDWHPATQAELLERLLSAIEGWAPAAGSRLEILKWKRTLPCVALNFFCMDIRCSLFLSCFFGNELTYDCFWTKQSNMMLYFLLTTDTAAPRLHRFIETKRWRYRQLYPASFKQFSLCWILWVHWRQLWEVVSKKRLGHWVMVKVNRRPWSQTTHLTCHSGCYALPSDELRPLSRTYNSIYSEADSQPANPNSAQKSANLKKNAPVRAANQFAKISVRASLLETSGKPDSWRKTAAQAEKKRSTHFCYNGSSRYFQMFQYW